MCHTYIHFKLLEYNLFLFVSVLRSRMESLSSQPTLQGSGATTPDNTGVIDMFEEHDDGATVTSANNSFRLESYS